MIISNYYIECGWLSGLDPGPVKDLIIELKYLL